jgi:hypothetical protein
MPALTAKGRIQKGKDLENHVCERIKANGLDENPRRSYGSGNGNGCKADIDTRATLFGQAIGFECKHMDKINVPDAWRQTVKLQDLNYEPVLVIKQTADRYENTKVVIYLETFLEMVKEIKELEKRVLYGK